MHSSSNKGSFSWLVKKRPVWKHPWILFVFATPTVKLNYCNNHTEWTNLSFGAFQKRLLMKMCNRLSVRSHITSAQHIFLRFSYYDTLLFNVLRIQSTWYKCLIYLYYHTHLLKSSQTLYYMLFNNPTQHCTTFATSPVTVFFLLHPSFGANPCADVIADSCSLLLSLLLLLLS